MTSGRRSILPSTYNAKAEKKKKSLRSSFSPFARVLTIESHKDFTEDERQNAWWQKSDYEDFRKSTSKLVRSMLNENITGWLGFKDEAALIEKSKSGPLLESSKTSSLAKRELPPMSLSELQENLEHVNQKAKTAQKDVQAQSWWDRFGDLASFCESRHRQRLARDAIRIVLDEQRRQRMFQSPDPNKIRLAYMESSAWTREWSLALAAVKADEVRGNLDGKGSDTNSISALYAMKVSLSTMTEKPTSPVGGSTTTTIRLDANTASQIRYRQIVTRKQGNQKNTVAPVSPTASPPSPTTSPNDSDGMNDRDRKASLALAKKAAGYGANDSPNRAITPLLAGSGKVGYVLE